MTVLHETHVALDTQLTTAETNQCVAALDAWMPVLRHFMEQSSGECFDFHKAELRIASEAARKLRLRLFGDELERGVAAKLADGDHFAGMPDKWERP